VCCLHCIDYLPRLLLTWLLPKYFTTATCITIFKVSQRYEFHLIFTRNNNAVAVHYNELFESIETLWLLGSLSSSCSSLLAETGKIFESVVIQGWRRISSSFNRSFGLILRQAFTRSWHSMVTSLRKFTWALQMCSSCSKGMSPQTMS